MLNEVKVDKTKLLSTLEANKAKHVAEYSDAVDVYRKDAEKALRKRASEVRDGETLSLSIDLPQPQTFGAEYDRAIAMVEWSEDEFITLDDSDFRAFVLDEWQWGRQFQASTQAYNRR